MSGLKCDRCGKRVSVTTWIIRPGAISGEHVCDDCRPVARTTPTPAPSTVVAGTTPEERTALRINAAAYDVVPLRAEFLIRLLAERDALERERDELAGIERGIDEANDNFERINDLLTAARAQRDQAVGLLREAPMVIQHIRGCDCPWLACRTAAFLASLAPGTEPTAAIDG